MGSGASKTAAQKTVRKFPNRAPGAAVPPAPSTSAAPRRPAAPGETGRPAVAPLARDQAAAIREDGSYPHASSPDDNNNNNNSNNDAIQPDLARRLREIGVVQPNPTYSNSSTASPMSPPLQQTPNSAPVFPSPAENPVLAALEARQRLQREAEEELDSLGTSASQGRRFLQAGMIRDVLLMREKDASEAQIENRFNLRRGVLKRLGPRGLYEVAGGAEPAP